MRRTETPSWPYFFKQRRVASTRASRRTAGVARRNFGTRGFFFMYSLNLFLCRTPSWSPASQNLRGAIRPIIQPEGARDRLMRQLAGVHIETGAQAGILGDGGTPTAIGERLHIRQGGIGERKGRGPGHRSGHVRDRIMDD